MTIDITTRAAAACTPTLPIDSINPAIMNALYVTKKSFKINGLAMSVAF
jgi:hypothetical protein